LVSSGLMNKQVAAELGLAEIIVKIHPGHIMKKMGCEDVGRFGEKGRNVRNSSHQVLALRYAAICSASENSLSVGLLGKGQNARIISSRQVPTRTNLSMISQA
jgi:DNA-binding NarL/FixJ family response regulator